VLVVASEIMTKVTDYTDRTTCVLFGDGASAFLIELDEKNPSFLAAHMGANGELGSGLYCTSIAQSWNGKPLERIGKIYQDGRAVYNYVIKNIPAAIQVLLDKAELNINDINWFVPHSANVRMIQSITDKTKISMDKTLMSVVEYGNTSSVTIPLAIWSGLKAQKVKKGDNLLLYGFGGGLNHAGLIIKWQY
jgi:3-oxoacyl-[acyl-carrier-protein] synthase-3